MAAVQRWGNSLAVRIPARLAESLALREGTRVELECKAGAIVMRPQSRPRHRPALVISPKAYNRKTSLCVVCPATHEAKGYPFEVTVHTADGSANVIVADHVRSVNWKTRRVRRIDKASEQVLGEVVGRLEALLINPDC